MSFAKKQQHTHAHTHRIRTNLILVEKKYAQSLFLDCIKVSPYNSLKFFLLPVET